MLFIESVRIQKYDSIAAPGLGNEMREKMSSDVIRCHQSVEGPGAERLSSSSSIMLCCASSGFTPLLAIPSATEILKIMNLNNLARLVAYLQPPGWPCWPPRWRRRVQGRCP